MPGSKEEYNIAAQLVTARTALDTALASLGVARALSKDGPVRDSITEIREHLEAFAEGTPGALQEIVDKLTTPQPMGSVGKRDADE